MKIESVSQPSIIQPTGAKSEAAMNARERAIQMLINNKAQEQMPVSNPTKIAPEEMGAIKARHPETSEAPKAEAPVTTAPEETKPVVESEPKAEESLSSQYAILARKEKALRLRDQELKRRESEFKAQQDALKPKEEPKVDLSKYVDRERLLEDPITVLTNELGLTYDQLTDKALNAPRPEQLAMMREIKELREKISALESETQTTKKTFAERDEQQYKQAIEQIRQDVTDLVRSDTSFETIRASRSVGDVVELIERTYKEDGYLMGVEEAARQVEDYLVDEALKISRLKKIQDKLGYSSKSNESKKDETSNRSASSAGQMKTLTNAVSSSRQLTARERAIAAYEGRLNK